MASILQLLAVAMVMTAIVALLDWRFGLLTAGIGLFTVGYQMERKRVRPPVR